jgi:hypothetical protein
MSDLKQFQLLINRLDLDFLKKYLINIKSWSEQEASDGVAQYKNFLFLLKKYPHDNLPPSVDIDEVWHSHILHTKEYWEFSLELFGQYLHHNPEKIDSASTTQEKQKFMQEYQERFNNFTQLLYLQEFGYPIETIRYESLGDIFINSVKRLLKKVK